MSNGNAEVLREMREIVRSGKKLDIETRDRFLFAAIIDIYDSLEQLRPVLSFYKVSIWVISAVVLALIGAVVR